MQNHTDCICLTFLHCVFSNVSSNGPPERMHNHTGCICLTFPHCVFLNVSSILWHRKLHSYIGCIWLTFLHGASSNVSSNCLHEWLYNSHWLILVRFFSTVCFQVFPQIACQRGCIFTLVAFDWLFSTLGFQMCLQIACPTTTKVIIYKILIHHLQGLLSLVYCQFQTEKMKVAERRDKRWKWESLLKTIS